MRRAREVTSCRCGVRVAWCGVRGVGCGLRLYGEQGDLLMTAHALGVQFCWNQGYWKKRPSQQLFKVFIYTYFAATCFGPR
jgi:hypothetical protein